MTGLGPDFGDTWPSTRRRRGRQAALAVGALAVVAAGAFGVTQLTGGDQGGAATPEEAGERLLAAIQDEDVLGIADLLPAGERDLSRDQLESLLGQAERLGVVSDAFRLEGVAGVDIVFDDVELDVEEITDGRGGSDGLALVSLVEGTASIEVDGDELGESLGAVLDDLVGDVDVDDFDDEVDIEDFLEDLEVFDEFGVGNPFTVAVVEEGGRWHPSLLFTQAETTRQRFVALQEEFGDDFLDGVAIDDEPELDDPAVEAEGAGSPEEAVQDFVDAATDLDLERLIALLPPDAEGRVLQVYAQYFLEPLQESVDTSDFDLSVDITDFDVDDAEGGDLVIPTAFEADYDIDGLGNGTATLAEGCIMIEGENADGDEVDEEVCFDDLADELEDVVDEVPDGLDELLAVFEGVRLGVVTVEHRGEHFVSPARTITELAVRAAETVARDDIAEGGALFDVFTGELDLVGLLDELFAPLGRGPGDIALPGGNGDEECEGVGCGFPDDEELPDEDEEFFAGTLERGDADEPAEIAITVS